jgi:hypothetical protein
VPWRARTVIQAVMQAVTLHHLLLDLWQAHRWEEENNGESGNLNAVKGIRKRKTEKVHEKNVFTITDVRVGDLV